MIQQLKQEDMLMQSRSRETRCYISNEPCFIPNQWLPSAGLKLIKVLILHSRELFTRL